MAAENSLDSVSTAQSVLCNTSRLHSTDPNELSEAVSSFRRILRVSDLPADLCVADVVVPLVALLGRPVPTDVQYDAVSIMGCIVRSEHFKLVTPALPALGKIVETCEISDTVEDACWVLSSVSNSDDHDQLQAVVALGVGPRLVHLAMPSEDTSFEEVRLPALRIIGNMLSKSKDHMQYALDSGALKALVPLLDSRNQIIRKEACWALSNVLAGNQLQIRSVMDTDAFSRLARMIREDIPDIKKEACIAVTNAIMGGSPGQALTICLQNQVWDALWDARLSSEDTAEIVIEGLDRFASYCKFIHSHIHEVVDISSSPVVLESRLEGLYVSAHMRLLLRQMLLRLPL